MEQSIDYSPRERAALWALAILGGLGVNGAFVYGLVARPGAMEAALRNPIAGAFVIEAMVLTVVLAYLLPRWRVSRISRLTFVVLALLGGLAFALPVALLWRRQVKLAE